MVQLSTNKRLYAAFIGLLLALALACVAPAGAFADTAVTKDANGQTSGAGTIALKEQSLTYQGHVQRIGWQGWMNEGALAGTTGKFLRVEAIKIKTENAAVKGSVEYRAHVQTYGWQNWVKDGALAGTTGKSKRLEAIQIRLTGDMAKKYDVYYRTHVQKFGWMGWAKNGESSGSEGFAYRLEGIEIKLVEKGGKAPGATANAFKKYVAPPVPSEYKSYVNRANKYSSRTSYIILVNCSAHRVAVLKGKKGSWQVVKFWKCTNGKASTPTKKGVFSVQNKGIAFGHGYTCWYWSQWYGNYLFHSVLYQPGSKTKYKDGRLGIAASHGCVRLALNNAKWIYDNVPRGTKVVVY